MRGDGEYSNIEMYGKDMIGIWGRDVAVHDSQIGPLFSVVMPVVARTRQPREACMWDARRWFTAKAWCSTRGAVVLPV